MSQSLPREFQRFRVGTAHVIAHDQCEEWARTVLASGTLHGWAGMHPERRDLGGRGSALSVPLPGQERRVVVRHARHGGLLGPMRGDLFFPPTRAPYELLVSHLLARAGVPTPPVVAIAVYRAGPLLRRSDVVTLELPGRDLGVALQDQPDETVRRRWLGSLARLVRAMTSVGAWHPDLNIRNVLLVERTPDVADAFVLDVDRIRFVPPGDPNVRDANLARLERSVRKYRQQTDAGFADEELRELRRLVQEPLPAPA